MKKELLIYGSITSLISSVMLLYGIGDIEYGYYDLLRIVVCITGALTAYICYMFKGRSLAVISALIAVLFNPLAKVSLEKETWTTIDTLCALYFLILSIVLALELKDMNRNKHQEKDS